MNVQRLKCIVFGHHEYTTERQQKIGLFNTGKTITAIINDTCCTRCGSKLYSNIIKYEKNSDIELKKLEHVVDNFSEEMKKKLREKYSEGFYGWDDPNNKDLIKHELKIHIEKDGEQYIDIANLSMMLWNLENKRKEVNK